MLYLDPSLERMADFVKFFGVKGTGMRRDRRASAEYWREDFDVNGVNTLA